MLHQSDGTIAPASGRSGFTVGPTKAIVVKSSGNGTRLMLPGEGGAFGAVSIYSDDHGATWTGNKGTGAVGEMDWTVCTAGACTSNKQAAPPPKYAMYGACFYTESMVFEDKDASRLDLLHALV
jgi:hypothetical protein